MVEIAVLCRYFNTVQSEAFPHAYEQSYNLVHPWPMYSHAAPGGSECAKGS